MFIPWLPPSRLRFAVVGPSDGDHGSSWVPVTAPAKDPFSRYWLLLFPTTYSILNG